MDNPRENALEQSESEQEFRRILDDLERHATRLAAVAGDRFLTNGNGNSQAPPFAAAVDGVVARGYRGAAGACGVVLFGHATSTDINDAVIFAARRLLAARDMRLTLGIADDGLARSIHELDLGCREVFLSADDAAEKLGVDGKPFHRAWFPETSELLETRADADRAARRTWAALTEVGARAGDGGGAKSPALSAKADAIDEPDAALLAFLNRNPSLRRKVSDVLPDKGPQDRKAVAKRLRKLADRTPPLVDYPKDGRSGVVILPAGAEALKRATAPTPR